VAYKAVLFQRNAPFSYYRSFFESRETSGKPGCDENSPLIANVGERSFAIKTQRITPFSLSLKIHYVHDF